MNFLKKNFRKRITFVFFIATAIVSISFALFSYHSTRGKFFEEFRSRLKNITYCGALSIDQNVLQSILTQMSNSPKTTIEDIENSEDYKTLSEQLNAIRAMEPDLIRYIYIVTPTSSPTQARFIIDADTLDALDKMKKGVIVDEKIDHVNSLFDMSEFSEMTHAVNSKVNLSESKISYDEDYKTWSISGFAPIKINGNAVATLGIDISADALNVFFNRLKLYYTLSIVIVLILSFIISSYLGKTIAAPILTIDAAMKEFSEKNFYVRVEPTTNDEVGDLFTSFNHLAHTIQEYSAQLMKSSAEIASSHETIQLLETRLVHIINAMPSAIIALDHNIQITHWNTSAGKMFGIPDYETLGKDLFTILPFLKTFQEDILHSITTHQNTEIRSIKVLGKRIHIYSAYVYPFSFAQLNGIVLRIDDVTATQRKERQERFSRNMELISHLAGGLTEDFNSIINGFSSMMKLLKHKYVAKGEPKEIDIASVLNEIESAGVRAETMSGYLSLFSQQQRLVNNRENLSEILEELASSCAAMHGNILVSYVPSVQTAYIRGDKALLLKALMNVCQNAVDALRTDSNASGTIMLALQKGIEEDSTDPEMWCVTISDNGVGMDEAILKKVLTPFYSTTETQAGLGLPIASAIIQLHKGYIDITSEPEKGTTVQIYLPDVETTNDI